MKIQQLLITSVAAVSLCVPVAAELYRWVDTNGQVHYSDTPHQDAEQIKLKRTNVFSSRPVTKNSEVSGNQNLEGGLDDASEQRQSYQELTVSAPSQGETLWNTGGAVNVKLNIQPALQKGHGVVFFLDGRAVNEQPVPGTSVTLEEVYRGTHTVRAAVYSSDGKVLMNGPAITFYVKQGTGG